MRILWTKGHFPPFPFAIKTATKATCFYFCYNQIQYASLNPSENTYSQPHTMLFVYTLLFLIVAAKTELIHTRRRKSILLLQFYTITLYATIYLCVFIVTLSKYRNMLHSLHMILQFLHWSLLAAA